MPVTSPPLVSQPATPTSDIDRAIADLQIGARRLIAATLDERINCVADCIDGVATVARDWVEAACRAKRIPPSSAARAEEVLVGPVAVVRYLQLIKRTLQELRSRGVPRLPGRVRVVGERVCAPTFPTRSLYDAIAFRSITAVTWLEPGVPAARPFGDAPDRLARRIAPPPRIAAVLGAGNVSSIPATDVLTSILQNDCAVLLKMNPVNEYLGPFFERALAPLVRAGMLRIVYGGPEVGSYAVQHHAVDAVHVTGSIETHDAIVWGADADQRRQRKQQGRPLLSKPVTSELGNVTPWAIVPGDYSDAQLMSQAENIAASIANNASFNCIATKLLITWRRWPQRQRFLDLVESILNAIPRRYAYYPGAAERYVEFAGGQAQADDQGRLTWLLRRDVDPHQSPRLLDTESFVCVTGEVALQADSPRDFLHRAVEFMNEQLWGTLAAAVTIPDQMRTGEGPAVHAALRRLRYGTIGVNLWPGVAYALMSPPWGAYPGADLANVQSGRGRVHNTYLLDRPEQTILQAPLAMFPKPMWFSTHRRPESLAWRLLRLYCRPALRKLPRLLGEAIRG
ncbi:MAG: aldehyde dehydrogenase [Planctomycetota bacterium]|nr:MAG: aldehyde dehydrogenase [Planctomycetota bacterium]